MRSSYADLVIGSGTSEQALAALERAIEVAPDEVDLRQRADYLASLGRNDEAIAELDLIIDLRPNDAYSLSKRAELELGPRQRCRCTCRCRKGQSKWLPFEDTISLIIQANLAVGHLEQALAEVTALQAQPYPQDEDPVLTFYRFTILDRLGRRREAEDALAGVSRERPEHILRIQVFLRNMGFEAVQISGTFDETTKQQLAACFLKGACSSTFQRLL